MTPFGILTWTLLGWRVLNDIRDHPVEPHLDVLELLSEEAEHQRGIPPLRKEVLIAIVPQVSLQRTNNMAD
jgi:hypothetical protein